MSHEIRTPMNAILGFTSLMSKTQMNLKQKDYINKVESSANSLLHIINDILDFSKIESGKFQLEKIKFNVEDVLNNLVSVVSLKAFNKGLEFVIMQNPQIPDFLEGDPYRLGQILLNLTDNAIKFTDSGEIFINIGIEEKREDEVVLFFEIRDTGIGMTEEQIKKLFNAFIQADTSTTRKYGGTGLGLTISKQLVELMGGNIEVKSEVGKGSDFLFTAKFNNCKVDSTKVNNTCIPLRELRTLIVEENENSREVLKTYINNFGFYQRSFSDVEDALRLFEEGEEFDIVIIGCKGLSAEGSEIISRIKSIYKGKITPKFICLTASSKENLMMYAKNLGYDQVLMKPVNQSVIYDVIISLYIDEFERTIAILNNRKFDYDVDSISGVKVLLAEDNLINQQLASELLEVEGVYVKSVNNGLEAFNELSMNKEKFDIILMDLHMPVLDGYNASKKIKTEIKDFNIPIIALTADAMLGTREKVLNEYMDDFITKPFIPEELFNMINKWVKRQIRFEKNSPNSDTSTMEFNIEGIDSVRALNRLKNDKKLYCHILKMFLEYKNVTNQFGEVNDENVIEKVRVAHTMKGLCGTIGASKMQVEYEKLESMLNSNSYFSKEFQKLVATISKESTRLMDAIEDFLIKLPHIKPTGKGYNGKKNSFKEDLNELIELLSNCDTRSKEKFEQLQNGLRGNISEEEFQLIRKYICKYDFEEANLMLKGKFSVD